MDGSFLDSARLIRRNVYNSASCRGIWEKLAEFYDERVKLECLKFIDDVLWVKIGQTGCFGVKI